MFVNWLGVTWDYEYRENRIKAYNAIHPSAKRKEIVRLEGGDKFFRQKIILVETHPCVKRIDFVNFRVMGNYIKIEYIKKH